MQAGVRYRLVNRHDQPSKTGSVIAMSSEEIWLQAEDKLRRGDVIEAAIAWPVRVAGGTPIQLEILGSVSEWSAQNGVLSIAKYEFLRSE